MRRNSLSLSHLVLVMMFAAHVVAQGAKRIRWNDPFLTEDSLTWTSIRVFKNMGGSFNNSFMEVLPFCCLLIFNGAHHCRVYGSAPGPRHVPRPKQLETKFNFLSIFFGWCGNLEPFSEQSYSGACGCCSFRSLPLFSGKEKATHILRNTKHAHVWVQCAVDSADSKHRAVVCSRFLNARTVCDRLCQRAGHTSIRAPELVVGDTVDHPGIVLLGAGGSCVNRQLGGSCGIDRSVWVRHREAGATVAQSVKTGRVIKSTSASRTSTSARERRTFTQTRVLGFMPW